MSDKHPVLTVYDPEGKYTVCYSWGVTAMVYDKTAVDPAP